MGGSGRPSRQFEQHTIIGIVAVDPGWRMLPISNQSAITLKLCKPLSIRLVPVAQASASLDEPERQLHDCEMV